MGTQIFLGKPPANIEQWIKNNKPTVVKYTAESGLPDWKEDIVGELTRLSIPNSSDAEVVEIGSHVTSIGNDVFLDHNELTSVTIPNGVTSIGEYAFFGCKGLTSMTIPNSVTSIGQMTFCDCGGLASITFSGKTKETVQGMGSYSWDIHDGCVFHCTDGDITI